MMNDLYNKNLSYIISMQLAFFKTSRNTLLKLLKNLCHESLADTFPLLKIYIYIFYYRNRYTSNEEIWNEIKATDFIIEPAALVLRFKYSQLRQL